jgi:hypothetical protein
MLTIRPPARLEHVGQHGLNSVEDAVEGDIDAALPFIEGDVEEPGEPFSSGRVGEDRDRPEARVDVAERRVDLRAIPTSTM